MSALTWFRNAVFPREVPGKRVENAALMEEYISVPEHFDVRDEENGAKRWVRDTTVRITCGRGEEGAWRLARATAYGGLVCREWVQPQCPECGVHEELLLRLLCRVRAEGPRKEHVRAFHRRPFQGNRKGGVEERRFPPPSTHHQRQRPPQRGSWVYLCK